MKIEKNPEPEVRDASENDRLSKKVPSSIRKYKLLIVCLIIIAALGFFSKSFVYSKPVDNFVVRTLVNIFPYPAVKVNGTTVSMKEYMQEHEALVNYFKTSESEEELTESQLQETIVDTLINKVIIQQIAKEYNVKVNTEQVDELYQEMIEDQENEEAFEQELAETFGWSKAVFKERIVKSIVLAMQTNETILENDEIQEEQRAIIEQAYTRIISGEDFETVAAEVHQQQHLFLDSDLGFQQVSSLPNEWREVVEVLDKDEMTVIIDLPEAYVVFKAKDRVVEKEDVKIHLLTLTVPKKTLETVAQDYLEKANIKRYLEG